MDIPTYQPQPVNESPYKKKDINFQELPIGTSDILNSIQPHYTGNPGNYQQQTSLAIPMDSGQGNSYLNLVLSPNLKDLELMIRGLEYIRQSNPVTGKEEIVLRKIEGHPLNEYGINSIMQQLKVFTSPEIKLGRKKERDYYNSVNHVCHSIVRLIYKNLKNFGMDTQVKQRNAKTFCNSIIEFVDSSYSRSISGRENDLSRATNFEIVGNIDALDDPSKHFNKEKREQLKN